jgi:hypothetical protein
MDPGASTATATAEGATAGVAATVVMTAVLEAGRRWSSFHTHPPIRIVRTLVAGGPDRPLSGEMVLAAVAHLGYGAACGVLFALLTRRRPTAGPPMGVGYGLVLWFAGYGGWVPTMGALPPPQRDQPGRQIALVAGHLVYGVVLATSLRRLRNGERGHPGHRPTVS